MCIRDRPLTIGESIDGELEQQGDRDWFAVSLQAEKHYEFSLNGKSLTDPVLTLRNKEGLEISINDDHGEGLNSLIAHQASTSEIFFLDVGSYDNQLIGTYTINATEINHTNDGSASFSIDGTPESGQTLSIIQTIDDPDGNGSINIQWQASNDDGTWSVVSSNPEFFITDDLEGRQIRASVSYIDAEGFSESVITTSIPIPITYTNDGSASFSIDGTPESGQTLSIIQTIDDPDGNGSINIQWQASNDDGTWSVVSSNPEFFITDDLEGRQIRASVSYVDAEGFSESVITSSIPIPITYTNDGSASFSIDGTPEIGQTLSIIQTVDDPDGNGSISIQWQASNDDGTWSVVSLSLIHI